MSPPAADKALATDLAERAAKVGLGLGIATHSEFDIVVSGGGNLNAFSIGIQSVLLAAGLNVVRWAGTSGGADGTFDVILKGVKMTMAHRLAYARIFASSRLHSSSLMEGMQSHHWRQLGAWETARYDLKSLDATMHIATACAGAPRFAHKTMRDLQAAAVESIMHTANTGEGALATEAAAAAYSAAAYTIGLYGPATKIISGYPSPEQAASAFIAASTYYEPYDGLWCLDGGLTTGPDMTPLFYDSLRPQLVVKLVSLAKSSAEMMAQVGVYNTSSWSALVKRGQDAMVELLGCGLTNPACSTEFVVWCPTGAANATSQSCGPHAPALPDKEPQFEFLGIDPPRA